ncbi:hypothetical protein LJR231_001527 [Phyllobacterium sp. LjRoot231]|uniref:hypothetical protein n=1 Tax=Phyllobacterium sp. LjRoot231 TaxID=3342289 RepID=UPI003ED029C8
MTDIENTPAAPSQLAEFIIAEVHRQTSEDKLRAHVEKKIGEAIEGAVNDAFRSYGSVNKQIEQVVQKALDIGQYKLDVPAYGNMVMALLRAKMDETLSGLINAKISEEMAEILSIAPKELKLSQVVETMVKYVEENSAGRYGASVTCLVEEAYPDSSVLQGYLKVYLDEEERVQPKACAVQITVTPEGKFSSLTIEGMDAKTSIKLGPWRSWQKLIFAAYCSGSTFIVDEDHVSTNIGDY